MNIFDKMHRHAIGFESLFNQIDTFHNRSIDTYPPHDIIKQDEENFCIEMALAGFKKDELTITWQKDLLIIEGDRAKRNDNEHYIYKSIGHRTFKKVFSLSELVEVKDVNFEDGVLHIHLQKNIPEEDKPKQISIN